MVELRARLILGVVKLRTTFGVLKLRVRLTFGVGTVAKGELNLASLLLNLTCELELTSEVDGIRGSLRLGAEPMVRLR